MSAGNQVSVINIELDEIAKIWETACIEFVS